TNKTVDGHFADVRRAGRRHRSGTELLTRLQRQKGQIYSSRSISPLISSERPIPPSVSVASAGNFSLPLSLPSAKPCRTALSISRWAVTPSLLRNFRMLVLKTSSFIITSVLQLPLASSHCCWLRAPESFLYFTKG